MTQRRIPLTIKVLYTLFMCVLVPVYGSNYGPANFLFFCDIALFLTLLALWLENSLLASMQAVAILIPQTIWVIDFITGLLLGSPPTGMTAYMFKSELPLFLRGLSLFHGWLPILLFWMVWRLGYDRRAFVLQTALAWIVLVTCYFVSIPLPPRDSPNAAANVNYVFGFPQDNIQETMPPVVWLVLLMLFHPICIFWPTHWVLGRLFARDRGQASRLNQAVL